MLAQYDCQCKTETSKYEMHFQTETFTSSGKAASIRKLRF